ncbi:MAG: diphosphatase [Streptosporangiaceae bacterium]|jgi:NADH pyrophosphatase NudC (nudix superfamily)|nr:diphosphatase [Streptosporangiaceae bacterium]
MSAAQGDPGDQVSAGPGDGAAPPDAQEYAGELGGFVLARGAVDRMSVRRGDTDWLAAAWADPRTRVLVLDNARALVRFGDKEAELILVPPSEAPEGLRFLLGVDDADAAYFGVMGPPGCLDSLIKDVEVPAGDSPAAEQDATGQETARQAAPEAEGPAGEGSGEEPPEQQAAGQQTAGQEVSKEEASGQEASGQEASGEEASGEEASEDETPEQEAPEQQTVTEQVAWLARARPGLRPAGLREAAALLNDRDAGLFTHAVALANWHATHTHCPRCGTPTVTVAAGHAQRCPADGSEHFPRIDPAVIMLVTDPDDRCLLARNRRWPERRVSILAGFVEPGEAAEQAVAREVEEETGIAVTRVRYVGSQPWPMPQSLMLGFRAAAVGELELRVDDDEIAEAHWYSREELRRALAAREILLPPPVSIAHRLIESWYGEELPGVW